MGRLQRVQAMVYNVQDDWACGLCPQSGTLKTKKHKVSETGSVPYSDLFLYFYVQGLKLALSNRPNTIFVSNFTRLQKQMQFRKTSFLLCFQNIRRWTESKTPVITTINVEKRYHHACMHSPQCSYYVYVLFAAKS